MKINIFFHIIAMLQKRSYSSLHALGACFSALIIIVGDNMVMPYLLGFSF